MNIRETVLITGASSGIGFELSKIFAKKGYNLVLVSQNEHKLEKAASEIQLQNHNVQISIISKDLSDPSSPEEIFEQLKQKKIQVDILVNNAGFNVYGSFHEVNLENILDLISVNLLALTKLTHIFMKGMVERGYGRILNLGSTGSFQPVPINTVYCATKAYVLSFSEGIADELKGTGVTVTALCPGPTQTNFAKRADIEEVKLFNMMTMDAKRVTEEGYKALMKEKIIKIPGLVNSLLVFLVRFMPRGLITKVGKYLMSK